MYPKSHKIGWVDVLLVSGVVLIIVGLGMSIRDSGKKNEVEIVKAGERNDIQVNKKVTIDISGEVMRSGVYEFMEGSRINEALAAAGGLSVQADREWVDKNLNRAETLIDGQKIYIPKKGETLGDKVVPNSGKISLNRATVDELDTLPGVGPAIATRIIEYREKVGGFKNINEIKLVSGIGEKMYERIKDKISL